MERFGGQLRTQSWLSHSGGLRWRVDRRRGSVASGRGTAGRSGLTGWGSGVVSRVMIAAGMGGCVGGVVGGGHDSGAHSAGDWEGGLWVGGTGGSGCGPVGRGLTSESLSESDSGGKHCPRMGPWGVWTRPLEDTG